MDADRFFLRLAAERGLVAPALAQECAARAGPGEAARMLVERARIPTEVARGLMVEAQHMATSGTAALRSSLIESHGPMPPGFGTSPAPLPVATPVAPTQRHDPQGITWQQAPTTQGMLGSSRPGTGPFQLGATLGRYRLEAELGRGGMGVVWRARQTDLDRDVALKILPPGDRVDERTRQRFAAEARAVARLSHPHIVAVHDVGELDGVQYFTMEYVDGGSLDSIPGGQALPADRVLEIGIALADALECAHAAGIVHRDLKPGNVLLTRNGTPRLTDFGIAKQVHGGSLTQSGEILGTPAYMSPEQADGQRTGIDGRTDIYSAGAILYRLLTGHPPFEAATPYEVLRKVLTSAVVPPRRVVAEVPRPLEQVVLRCLEKERDKRYASASELGQALRQVRDELPAGALEPTRTGGGFGPPRWFWASLGLGLLLLAGTGAGVLAWREHQRASAEAARVAAEEAARREDERKAREAALRTARTALESAPVEPRTALEQARKAAKDAPEVPEVQAILGLLLLEAGDAQGALTALELAIARIPPAPPDGPARPTPPDPLFVAARGARGRCLVQLGREATTVQAEADALDGLGQLGKAAAAELRGELALRDGKPSLAATQLGEAVRLLPDDARLRRRLARAHLEQHKPERALSELDGARRLQPDSVDERTLRAAVLLQLGQADEAMAEIKEALRRDPERKEAREVLARIERQTRRTGQPPTTPPKPPGDAEHASPNEQHERCHQALKEAASALGRQDQQAALRLFQASLAEREANCPGLLHERAMLGRTLGRLQDAHHDLTRLLKREEKVQTLLELADLEIDLKRGEQAGQLIQRAIKLEPRSPAPWAFLARIQEQQRRPDEAEKAWAAALERAPQDAEGIHERGHFFERQGRREEALADLDRALELKPGHGHYLVVRGELLLGLGRSDEARAALETALRGKLTPGDEKHAREAMARLPAAQSEPPR